MGLAVLDSIICFPILLQGILWRRCIIYGLNCIIAGTSCIVVVVVLTMLLWMLRPRSRRHLLGEDLA